jgi:SAM-dependent methyltransferase
MITPTVGAIDPDQQRAENLDRWERAAGGWGKRADRVRDTGMAVSVWMIDQLGLQPGQRVLELAAGPGDTGFLAAELIRPGGTLICSDGTEAMLEVARERAASAGIENVEFARLELEWIDLPTASVDAVLCRWGIMLIVDPDAAGHEIRRVLRSGGRAALAVWDSAERNPWATIPGRALVKLGHAEPPDPAAPGMFTLAAPGSLQELLDSAGLLDVVVEQVELDRPFASVDEYFAETLDLSGVFRDAINGLSGAQRTEVTEEISSLAEPFTDVDGSLLLPGSSLVAAAGA